MANGSTQMIRTATLDRATERLTPAAAAHRGDDKAMLKAAANLTRDLNVPKPPVYWADMIGSALLGYAGLFTAMTASGWMALAAGLVAVLALYRAGRYQESVECFEASAKMYRPKALEWCFLAMAHHRLGHVAEARRCLEEARRWIDAANQATAPIPAARPTNAPAPVAHGTASASMKTPRTDP